MAELVESSSKLVASARNDMEVIAWSGGNSLALAVAGRSDDAVLVLDRAISTLDAVEFGLRIGDDFVLSWLAEAAVSVGHAPMLNRCRETFATGPGRVVGAGATHGTTDLWLGIIDTALGDVDRADFSFAAAEAHCLRLDLPLWVNLTRCFWAESLTERDPERARVLARAALAGAEPLGHHVVTNRARALLDPSRPTGGSAHE